MSRSNRVWIAALVVCSALLTSGFDRSDVAGAPASGFDSPSVEDSGTGFGADDIARFLSEAGTGMSKQDVRRTSVAIVRSSREYGLDPLLVTQVLWVESGARPWVRSPRGAIGLMQVMPHMARPLGLAGNLASIETNIEAGCWILADNIRRLGEEDGISAYFWGSDIRSVAYLHRVREARATVRGPSES